jgi:hypothetical protein
MEVKIKNLLTIKFAKILPTAIDQIYCDEWKMNKKIRNEKNKKWNTIWCFTNSIYFFEIDNLMKMLTTDFYLLLTQTKTISIILQSQKQKINYGI